MAWFRLIGCALWLAFAAGEAAAQPSAPEASMASTQLYVSLIVNGRAVDDVVALELRGGALMVDAGVLRRAGVAVPGSGAIDLAATAGLRAAYDPADQVLTIDADATLLPLQHVAGPGAERTPIQADTGILLNYDLYVQGGASAASASLWTEQRVFGPAGSIANTGVLRVGGGRGGYLRYDTSATRIDYDRMISLTAGDFVTRSLPWTGSVRMAGLQIARDFGIRPDLVTTPLPTFAGSAALPSSVDLLIDGFRQQHADVTPGRFELDSVPVVNGAGSATIVTTDAIGRQVRTAIPFYVSPDLLRPGLVAYAGEVGFLRRRYGQASFGYGPAAASGTIRAGLLGTLTGEAHVEATRSGQLGGIGFTFAPWRLGTLNASAAIGSARAGRAYQWSIGYSYVARWFSVAAQHIQRSDGFRDLASFDLASYTNTRSSDQLLASAVVRRIGSVGAAFASERLGGVRTAVASATWSRPLGRGATLFASFGRELRRGGTTAQIRLSLPFGRGAASAGASLASGRPATADLAFDRAPPRSGGLGMDVALASGANGDLIGQGTAIWRTTAAQFQAGAATAGGRTSWWGSATGSVVALAGGLFTANQVGDAFAVVATGAPGVPVLFENQSFGRTDRRGDLLIPTVVADLPAHFAIDALGLGADQTAAVVDLRAAVARNSGAVVRLPVRHERPVTLALVDAIGSPIAVGALAHRPGTADVEIGYDGLAYLPDARGRVTVAVTWRGAPACVATIEVPDATAAGTTIGPVRCL